MNSKPGFCALVVSLTLGVAVTFGPTAGSGAKAQELDWATSAGGTDVDVGLGIATDPRGNVYVTGVFTGTATFGADEANETELTANPGGMFAAKYAPDGTLLWATSASGGVGEGIATDPRGNGYVTGRFIGTATFGADEANETELTAAGCEDVFVAKYAPDGHLLWATSAGGTSHQGFGIATDPRGNVYVTGRFPGTAKFGADDEACELEFEPLFNVFVAKYAPDGHLLWATSASGGASVNEGRGIATDPRGNSYVTGLFLGTATFGADEANETELNFAGFEDVFVAKYRR